MSYKPFSTDRSLEDQVKWTVNTLGYLDTVDPSKKINRIRERKEADLKNGRELYQDITNIFGREPKEVSDDQVAAAIDLLVSYDHGLQYDKKGYKITNENEKEHAKTSLFERLRVNEQILSKYLKDFWSRDTQDALNTIIGSAAKSSTSRLYKFCMDQLTHAGYMREQCMKDIQKAYGFSEKELPWYASSMEEISQAIQLKNQQKESEYDAQFPSEEKVAQDRQHDDVRKKIDQHSEDQVAQWERKQGRQLPPELRRQQIDRLNQDQEDKFIRQGILPPKAPQGPAQNPGMGGGIPGVPAAPMGGGPAAVPQPNPPPAAAGYGMPPPQG